MNIVVGNVNMQLCNADCSTVTHSQMKWPHTLLDYANSVGSKLSKMFMLDDKQYVPSDVVA